MPMASLIEPHLRSRGACTRTRERRAKALILTTLRTEGEDVLTILKTEGGKGARYQIEHYGPGEALKTEGATTDGSSEILKTEEGS